MAESVYKVISLVGTSDESWEKAASAAISRAGSSLRAYSGPSRSPIPAQADHPFRAKPITDSGASRSPFRAKPITFGTRADDGLPPRPPAG